MSESVLSADHFHNEAAAVEFIEAHLWPNGPVCPRCGETSRVGRLNAEGHKIGMCKCYVCRKPFAVTVGTVMESSHIPLHVWLQAMHLVCTSKKGVSVNQMHRMLGITLKSAWFLGHRIRESMKEAHGIFGPMGGQSETVEADETYVGGKAHNRAFGPIPPKQAAMSLVQRGGKVRSFHIPNVTVNNLAPIVARPIHADGRCMTDESNVYARAGRWFSEYQTVNHSAKEYVRETPPPIRSKAISPS